MKPRSNSPGVRPRRPENFVFGSQHNFEEVISVALNDSLFDLHAKVGYASTTYPYAHSQILDRYRAHPNLLACAASILGPDLIQIVNQVNFNPPGGGVGWGWHQDYRFRKAGMYDVKDDFVQTLLAIDLCSAETGGLRVIPGSPGLGSLKLDQDNENAETHFDATRAITPVLQPGDVILFNSHMIHGSTANRSTNLRRVYINGFARAAAASLAHGAMPPLFGIPVLRSGVPITTRVGMMEYEGDRETLPKASKY